MSNRRMLALLFCGASALGVSCEACGGGGGGSGGGSGGGGQWLVGESGLMLNIDRALGGVRGYPLETKASLRGIACRGERQAWVVGDGGLLLATDDGGASWRSVQTGVGATLRSIAVSETGRAVGVGDGVFIVSEDSGATWRPILAPAIAWSAVALGADGTALAVALDGSIHRHRDGLFEPLVPAGGAPLRGVSMASGGGRAVAVGDRGRALVSEDGGTTWRPLPLPTVRALADVWLVEGGQRLVAVGEAGVVVDARWNGEAKAAEMLGEGAWFRGLHLESNGTGTIVGDRGTVLTTEDGGATWSWFLVDDRRDIHAVDAIRAGAHHL